MSSSAAVQLSTAYLHVSVGNSAYFKFSSVVAAGEHQNEADANPQKD